MESPEAVPPAEGSSELAPPEVAPVPGPRATWAARVWVGILLGIVILALLLVFIFQNLHHTTVHFFTATGSLPVALVLLIAALGGAALVLLVGSVRILQLRREVRGSVSVDEGHGRRSRRRAARAGVGRR